MATPWATKLQRFQQSLVTARKMIDADFHFGVIQVRSDAPLPVLDTCPQIYASTGTIVECLALPAINGLLQYHYVFADYHASDCTRKLNHFKSQLGDIHDILAIVPDRVAAVPAIPPLPNRLDENFIRWGLLLLWLGGHENKVFHSEAEFAMTASEFGSTARVKPWGEFSTVPGCDALSLLTLTSEVGKGWDFWIKQYADAGRQFPEVLAASLTKPLFYASINAIDLLIAREANISSPQGTDGEVAAEPHSPSSKRSELQRAKSMNHILTESQQEVYDVINDTPLRAKEINARIAKGVEQTTRKCLAHLIRMNVIHRVPQGYVRGPADDI